MNLNDIIVDNVICKTCVVLDDKGELEEKETSASLVASIKDMLRTEKVLTFKEETRGIGKTTLMLKLGDLTGIPVVVQNSRITQTIAKEKDLRTKIFDLKTIDKLYRFFKNNPSLERKVFIDDITHDDVELLEINNIKPIGFVLYKKGYLSNKEAITKIQNEVRELYQLANIPNNLLSRLCAMKDAALDAYYKYEEAKDAMMLTRERTEDHNILLRTSYNNRVDEFKKAVDFYIKEKANFEVTLKKIREAVEGDE